MWFSNFINRKIKRLLGDATCLFIVGDRGAGKSSLLCMATEISERLDLTLFSTYPVNGAVRLPLVEVVKQGVHRMELDKAFLYNHDFHDCIILLDECRTLWPARGYKDWTASDDEFFNFLRKNNIRLWLSSQAYDAVDLNIRRAADYCVHLSQHPFFRNTSYVDISKTTLAKVADRNTELVGRGLKRGLRKVSWEVCEAHVKDCKFARKPYYGLYDTYYTPVVREPLPSLEELGVFAV
ncbi:MAG: hypothetical protein LBC83_01905 [Oscillospiraceae bacterium]|jgi:hypothetical protein|nr:hypothetical protein [Oscillospiraceae bacterium]